MSKPAGENRESFRPNDEAAERSDPLGAEIGAEVSAEIEKMAQHIAAPQKTDLIENITRLVSRRLSVSSTNLHVGPFPPPDQLRLYEEIYPGFTAAIVKSLEADQMAFVEGTKDKRKRDDRYRILALVLGMIALLVILGVVVYLAISGHDAVAISLAAAGVLTGAISAFVQGQADKNVED